MDQRGPRRVAFGPVPSGDVHMEVAEGTLLARSENACSRLAAFSCPGMYVMWCPLH